MESYLPSMERKEVEFVEFLRQLESPLFKKNAEKIFAFIQRVQDSALSLKLIVGACLRTYENQIEVAHQELLFLKQVKSTHAVQGNGYKLTDNNLVFCLYSEVEASYLNHLVDIERAYKRTASLSKQAREVVEAAKKTWLDEESVDLDNLEQYIKEYEANNTLNLPDTNTIAIFLIRWFEDVLRKLPYSVEVASAGRPFTLESINAQLAQFDEVDENFCDIAEGLDDNLADEFLQSLLKERVKIDTKMCRDVYRTLVLFDLISKDQVHLHDVANKQNPTNRETYIRQKFYRLIAQSPELCAWYDVALKGRKKKTS